MTTQKERSEIYRIYHFNWNDDDHTITFDSEEYFTWFILRYS